MGSERLPRYVVLSSKYNGKCLSYLKEKGQVHGYLQFSGEQAVSPEAKFEVETAQSSDELVHIRCCYNNKYWTRVSSHDLWIVAAADKPEEDQSKLSCTLFKPIFLHDETVRFIHLQSGNYACFRKVADPFNACLHAGSKIPSQDFTDACTTIDWESLVILPKHVAFKGNNGKYLRSHWQDSNRHYLKFSGTDRGDKLVGHEIFDTKNGSIRIKSDGFGQFWRRSPNWIWGDTDDTTSSNSDTLFWPVKVDNNKIIALRNLGNDHFCKPLTTEGKTSCLNAAVSTITEEAKLEVEELVITRQIYDIKYRLKDARIYKEQVLTLDTGEAMNRTATPSQMGVKLAYTETKSRTWSHSFSMRFGVSVSFEAGVPTIGNTEIQISSEFEKAYQWGETNEKAHQIEHEYTVTVPPMSTVKVKMIASRGSCDVPFSYTQRDTLFDGRQVVQYLDDGMFTGINCFNVRYEHEEVASLETLTRLHSSTRCNIGV